MYDFWAQTRKSRLLSNLWMPASSVQTKSFWSLFLLTFHFSLSNFFVSVFLFPIFLTHFRCEYCFLILSISFVWFLCFLQLLSRHLLLLVCCSLVSFRKSFCFPLELCFSLFPSVASLRNLCQAVPLPIYILCCDSRGCFETVPWWNLPTLSPPRFRSSSCSSKSSFVSWRSCWFDFPFLLHCDFIKLPISELLDSGNTWRHLSLSPVPEVLGC